MVLDCTALAGMFLSVGNPPVVKFQLAEGKARVVEKKVAALMSTAVRVVAPVLCNATPPEPAAMFTYTELPEQVGVEVVLQTLPYRRPARFATLPVTVALSATQFWILPEPESEQTPVIPPAPA